jgi:hypothetical protein
MTEEDEKALMDLLELDMEYRLTVALRMADGCEACVGYLIDRRDVLLPEILRQADLQAKAPADIFHSFQQKVHARHESTD